MQTYSERLESLEEKVDKVLNVLNPQQPEDKDEVVEKLHDLNKDVGNINGKLHFLTLTLDRIEEEVTSKNTKEEEKIEDLKKFNTERIAWFSGSAILLLGITYLLFTQNSILFLIPSGFFVANLGILMQLFYDWKLTPGDSYAKISKHPIALAITLLVIAFYTYMGISVGEKFIPDSFRGEASQRIEERLNNIERVISNKEEKKQVPETSEDDDFNGGESDRIPNR